MEADDKRRLELNENKTISSDRCNGTISVYLILTFTVLLSLILVIIEGARENAIKMKVDLAADLSLYSAFAEYNRELLKQFDLFFIDASYGLSHPDPANVGEHIKGYMNENFKPVTEVGIVKDLTAIEAQQVDILRYSLATDEGGEVFKRQAVLYMEDLLGMSYFDAIRRQQSVVEDNELFTRDVQSERLRNQSELDSIEIPKKQKGKEWEEVELNNPADQVNATRGNLALVLNEGDELSVTSVNPANYVSGRTIEKGDGLAGRDGVNAGEELIFNEYLMTKFGCFTSQKEESELKYELEYLLEGKSSDIENLKAVVNKLLLLRETANVTYLFSDAAKMAEAEALAIALTVEIPVPGIEILVKLSLVFAWAYAEAVYDVRSLLHNKRVPLMKTAETWHYSLEGMMGMAGDSAEGEEGSGPEDGLSYKDYLRVFLMVEGNDKTLRATDVIEMDIRRTTGNQSFRMDGCMDLIRMNAYTISRYGKAHEVEREYFYM